MLSRLSRKPSLNVSPRSDTMASPVLDEISLAAVLDPRSGITLDMLREAALDSIIAAHDRKILREPFEAIERRAAALITSVTMLEYSCRLRRAYTAAEETSPALEAGIERTISFVIAHRLALQKLVQGLSECPEDTDKIN